MYICKILYIYAIELAEKYVRKVQTRWSEFTFFSLESTLSHKYSLFILLIYKIYVQLCLL